MIYYGCPEITVAEDRDTDYIDYIKVSDLGDNNDIVKGIDKHGRQFLTIKAQIEYSNGEKINTLTTFFKRYTEKYSVWCSTGKDELLFYCGAMSLSQHRLLKSLLENKNISVDEDISKQCHITCEYYSNDDKIYPVSLSLGHIN